MPGFYGYRSVLSDLQKHIRGTGKVTTATLKIRTALSDTMTSVAWKNVYLWPQDESTGLGSVGHPTLHGRITAWRIGETSAPRVDDKWTVGDTTYLITRVQPRLDADVARNFAVYDCDVVD